MDVTIKLIRYEDKDVLRQLLQLYRYDSSEFDGHVINQHGFYSYKYLDHQWTEDYRRPYLVKCNGEIAGFALLILDVPRDFVKLSTAEKTNVVSDFFIMRKFRHQGVGKKVAFLLFEQHKGVWEIKQTVTNTPAYQFWKKVITGYLNGQPFREKMFQNGSWNGPVIVFEQVKEEM